MRGVTVIGITGGIGAGKSVVSRILRLKGYEVYDCDMEARHIMHHDQEVMEQLRRVAGDALYTPDGMLDRQYLASRLFSDGALRTGVNGIVHSAVRDDLMQRAGHMAENRLDNPLLFCESAILGTSHLDKLCSVIWIVDAPLQIRIDRVAARNGHSTDHIMARIQAQAGELALLPPDKCVTLDNSGNSPLLTRIDTLLKEIKI